MTQTFWDVLDSTPGLTAAKAEWQRRLGNQFDQVAGFLRPTGDVAESLPREAEQSFRIVCHGTDDYVGVCPDGGPTIALTRDELLLHELHQSKLAGAVASALKLTGRCAPVDGIGIAWLLGRANQTGRANLSVFMVFRIEQDEYRKVALELQGQHRDGLVMLTTTGRICFSSPSVGLSLRGLFGFGKDGSLVPAWSGDSWMTDIVPLPVDSVPVLPNPEEHTTAKVWTIKSGAIRMSTKTDKNHDGQVEFAPLENVPQTFQMKFIQLITFKYPDPISLGDVIHQVYPDDYATALGDATALAKVLRKVRTLVSDIRIKKFAKAGINPDVLPSLSIEASKDTGIALRLAHLHRMDDKELDEADEASL